MIRHALFATLAIVTAGGLAAQIPRTDAGAATATATATALADPARADQATDDDRRMAAQALAFRG
ncbi:hypothetical protein [uncultured Sphingomonas sp.]|uniref:hypothetical protein n=1 Tax=uncultured Sphingomonas sp. TaxID=158754 RepID=UPI0035C9A1E0